MCHELSLEEIETLISWGFATENEYGLEDDEYKLLDKLTKIQNEIKIKIRQRIINNITTDCDHINELGYDSWKSMLSDANMEDVSEYNEVLYNDFTEDELEKIWQESHEN